MGLGVEGVHSGPRWERGCWWSRGAVGAVGQWVRASPCRVEPQAAGPVSAVGPPGGPWSSVFILHEVLQGCLCKQASGLRTLFKLSM